MSHQSTTTTTTGTPMPESTNIVPGPKSRITEALDAMNPLELRNAAYRGLMAQAYSQSAYTADTLRKDLIEDHLAAVTTYDMDKEREDFRDAQIEAGYSDDVAEVNYWRRLLNMAPLTEDGQETDPQAFEGWNA